MGMFTQFDRHLRDGKCQHQHHYQAVMTLAWGDVRTDVQRGQDTAENARCTSILWDEARLSVHACLNTPALNNSDTLGVFHNNDASGLHPTTWAGNCMDRRVPMGGRV
jgi:hypothetical protein